MLILIQYLLFIFIYTNTKYIILLHFYFLCVFTSFSPLNHYSDVIWVSSKYESKYFAKFIVIYSYAEKNTIFQASNLHTFTFNSFSIKSDL